MRFREGERGGLLRFRGLTQPCLRQRETGLIVLGQRLPAPTLAGPRHRIPAWQHTGQQPQRIAPVPAVEECLHGRTRRRDRSHAGDRLFGKPHLPGCIEDRDHDYRIIGAAPPSTAVAVPINCRLVD
jgi:hypothetical protein